MSLNRLTRRELAGAFLGLIVGLVIIIVVTAVLQTRTTQVDSAPKIDKQTRILHVLVDCTSPKGKCYKRGQTQTSKAVGNITQVSVYAAACAVGLDPTLPVAERVVLINNCILEQLKKKHQGDK